MRVKSVFVSHPGKVRTVNQDGIFADGTAVSEAAMTKPDCRIREIDESAALYAVIDGVGGRASGEVAAGVILQELRTNSELLSEETISEETGKTLSSVFTGIQESFAAAEKAKPELSGMAATLAGIFISERGTLAFNYGDCRSYIFRGGFLEKLTHDHSHVQSLHDQGLLDEDEMRTHPQKNYVTKAIQAHGEQVELYTRFIKNSFSERFLICCDGVWESLTIDDIEKCLRESSSQDAAQKLLDALLASECRDNISFIILDTGEQGASGTEHPGEGEML